MNLKNLACFLLVLILEGSVVAQIQLAQSESTWSLEVDGNPFDVKGVTFGYNDPSEYGYHFRKLKSMGVNTIRTWGTDENTRTLLDSAHAEGIKVMVGIWMRHGRPGMEADDSFNYLTDEKGKQEMFDQAIVTVRRYKNHPAVLFWGIGNEVYLNIATDAEKRVYSQLLEQICKEVNKLDGAHPIVSVEAWTFGLDWWNQNVPSIDIYGINTYGAGANIIEDEIKKKGINKPYVITEFGVQGEWDAQKDQNGISVEPSDQQKYDAIAMGYHEWIASKPSNIGGYIFHYADGKDFIAPWLFTHYKGMTRPQFWAIREAYTGQAPRNRTPNIESFELPDESFKSNVWIPVDLSASDFEKEELTVSFSYNQRTGSRKRRDQIVELESRGSFEQGFEILTPKENGPIKVYVEVRDEYNNVGIASTSIIMEDPNATKKYLVPKAALPFYVYKDGKEQPYVPSGYMGNIEAISVDLNHKREVYSGESSIEITYQANSEWYGVGFVDPPNDWGEMLGGFDLTGAETFSFWAKSDSRNLKATIGFGLIDKDKPFPDTAKKSKEIYLTKKWKK